MKNEVTLAETLQFIVKLEYKNNTATGVILNPSKKSDKIYIFTVKHLFLENKIINGEETISDEEEKENIKNLEKSSLDFDDITIIFKNHKKTEDPIKLNFDFNDLHFLDDCHYDLAVFILHMEKNKNIIIDDLAVLESEFKTCSIFGYPANGEGEIKRLKCEFELEREEVDFQVISNTPLNTFSKSEYHCTKGLSGSGVFTRGNDQKIYLVGIQRQLVEETLKLTCISFQSIVEKINNFLDKKSLQQIKFVDCEFVEELGFEVDIKNFDYEKLYEKIKKQDNEFIRYINDKLLGEEVVERNLLENKLEEIDLIKFNKVIDDHRDYLNEKSKLIKSSMIEIADSYLYRAIICYKKGEYRKAKHNIGKAKKFNPDYNIPILIYEFYKNGESLIKENKTEVKKYLEEEGFGAKSRLDYLKMTLTLNQENSFVFLKPIYEEVISILDDIVKNNKTESQEEIEKVILEKLDYVIEIAFLFFKNKKYEDAEQYLLDAKYLLEKDEKIKNIISSKKIKELLFRVNNLLGKNFFNKMNFKKSEDYFKDVFSTLKSTKNKNDFILNYMINTIGYLMLIAQKLEPENPHKIDLFFKEAVKNIDEIKNEKARKEWFIKIEKIRRFTTSCIIDYSINNNKKYHSELKNDLVNMINSLKKELFEEIRELKKEDSKKYIQLYEKINMLSNCLKK